VQQRHQVAEQCKKRQHQPSDAYGTQGKAPLEARFRGTCYRLIDDMTTERGVVISGGSGLVTR
jgi:hypothetical protein